MARVAFDTIFKIQNGTIEPIQKIRVGGVTLGPGTKFSRGITFGGVDFTEFIGHDLEVETDGETLVIKAIYGKKE